MPTRFITAGILGSALLVGCAGEPGIEDGENDVFLTEEAKADAFGVEDWSPDGMAVLRLVSNASKSELEDDVGLTARAAKSIVDHRGELSGGRYHDLAELDAAKYIGITVFRHLLKHAADNHLFRTAIRIPLVVEGTDRVSITSFNDEAKAAGVTGFARYTFVDVQSDYSAKMATYDTRLQELATKAGITIDGEMMRYASTVNDYTVGSIKPCFIGDPLEVADVTSSQADSLMGDMYSLWGYRYKSTKWIYDDMDEDEMNFGDEWDSYSTRSKSVLLMSTNTDSGDSPEADLIPPCR